MRVTHWIGIILLLTNATFFTPNTIGMAIQYVLALVVFIHDIDEKKWGVDLLNRMKEYLAYFTAKNLSQDCKINAKYNSEIGGVLKVIDSFRQNIRTALVDGKQSSSENRQVDTRLH